MNISKCLSYGLKDGYKKRKKIIMHHSQIVQISSLVQATTVLTLSKSVGVYVCGQQALKTVVKSLKQI
jgi:hypothetical protein